MLSWQDDVDLLMVGTWYIVELWRESEEVDIRSKVLTRQMISQV
jgi:hypothetical protein